jgi:hypothetical protein
MKLGLLSTLALSALVLVSCGSQTNSTVQASKRSEVAIFEKVSVKRVNGGINPDYIGYEVTGYVMVGSNSCFAEGVTLSIEDKGVVGPADGRVHVLTAVRHHASNPICPTVYDPVFAYVTETFRFPSAYTVEIGNVGELGNNVPVEDYLN